MSANYDVTSGGNIEPQFPHEPRKVVAGKLEEGGKQVSLGGKLFDAEISESQSKLLDQAQYEKHVFSPDRVFLTISDNNSEKLVRVALKSRDVAAFLGVGESRVKEYVSEGNLEEWLTVQSRANQAEQSSLEVKPPANRPLESPTAVTPQVKTETLSKLDRYELSKEDYEQICRWYESNKAGLFDDGVDKHLTADQTGLPRTVIFIAEGPHKGLHVRSKVTVGTGSFNKAVRALHVDSGRAKVARGALEEHAPQSEIDRNKEYAGIDPEGKYFATGAAVKHKGKWRDRQKIGTRLSEGDLPGNISNRTFTIPQRTNADKVTFIMDEVPDGELAAGFYTAVADRERSPLQYMQILLHLNKGLSIAHRAGKVDIDYKAENIFMDGDTPKMADFGMAYNSGELLDKIRGTPGFLSPEVLTASPFEPITIQPANQMWIQGCVMAVMFKGMDFDNWHGQVSGRFYTVLDQSGLESAVDTYFPDNKTEGSIDWCIAQCLRYNPEDRISAEALQPHLEKILQGMVTDLAEQTFRAVASLSEVERKSTGKAEPKDLEDILTEVLGEVERMPEAKDPKLQVIAKRISSRNPSSSNVNDLAGIAHDLEELIARINKLDT